MSSVDHIRFELPADESRRESTQKSGQKAIQNSNQNQMFSMDEKEVFVGCPVWSNKDWPGVVYPLKTQPKDYLKYYAQKFSAIELNSTFYHLPQLSTLQKWLGQVGPQFLFCPKVPRDISHSARFNENRPLVTETLKVFSLFKENLGHAFLQLPPGFEFSSLHLLEKFLENWSTEVPLAVEFRHPSWFVDGQVQQRAQELLFRQGMTAVICDTPGRRDVLHTSFFNGTLFVRFLGAQGHSSDILRINEWCSRIKIWGEEGLIKRIYFFAHQPNDFLAPKTTIDFVESLNLTCDWRVSPPQLEVVEPAEDVQTSLF